MTYVVIKVGVSHHGKLVPGMLIVLPVDQVSPEEVNGYVYFTNPIEGGYSSGKIMLRLSEEEAAALSEDQTPQETSWERHSPINFDRR